ncbi:uncharacterized protein CXQ87_000738 [Candidozyma duobushaemuli]|uniref:Amino acid transporter transmembrane domain-containing protein n=1 Tax=Candidozyma duobushaemuli TaxID=1231522 RepID=A0A2V1AIS4_9ASCO|nr:uncharacterized protein CXQ87_000738 [[Candida] duobushaemulonis]PVH17839.1 hypothetical protein CXQ87_000738 [[Candida] duobushaemulonis]
MSDEEYTEDSRLLPSRRTSIFTQPVGSFRGPNSLHNFASSFTRAQSFAANQIDANISKKRSFFTGPDDNDSAVGYEDDELFDPDLMAPSPRGERLSTVLHEHNSLRPSNILPGTSGPSNFNEVFYQDDGREPFDHRNDTLNKEEESTSILFWVTQTDPLGATTASYFGIKRVEDKDGNLVTIIAGQSTAPQTVLNSINVLIGVGLLALPVGLLRGGWVIGFSMLLLGSAATYWTASLISKAMDTDQTIMTYADLGYASYGSTAKLLISIIFTIDLLGSGVSLVLLFSDSLYSLLGNDAAGWTKTSFKFLALIVLTPFTFMPLPILSIFSGSAFWPLFPLSCLLHFVDFSKLMPTNLWPKSIPDVFAAVGIIMAPFSGHAIFPNLKNDMRHPHKFTNTLVTTYTLTCLADCSMAIIGFFMFGGLCNNEVTSNLLETAGYPRWVYPLISALICLIPLAKTPLNAKPIISTLDALLDLDSQKESKSRVYGLIRAVLQFLVRVGVNVAFVFLAILVPEFDKIVGVMGSSICFLVCIILPCSFYMRLCKNNIRAAERAFVTFVIICSSILAVACTYFTIVH